MSTMELIGVGWRAARAASRERRAQRAGTRTRGRLAAVVANYGLGAAGLACFTAAAAMVAVPLGLAVAGAAFFILDWSVEK